jgi:hypothetical protein
MAWAHVEEDGTIEEYGELPLSWRNVSNLYTLESEPEVLKRLGWYRVVDETTPVSNDFLEYHGAPEYRLDSELSVVVKNRPIITYDNPPTPQQTFSQAREIFMSSLRQMRDELLKDSDWTQVVDVQETRSQEWILSWKTYRQRLRDLPNTYDSGTNVAVTNLNIVEWPEVPSK